ncbi:MAG: glycosyltransferase [Luteimonas sp.]
MNLKKASCGLLVLGMHRSGTSLLARLLQQCGIDIGGRQLGGSAGNEDGHWEDAFAVELHERLLASMGRRWDEVPVPSADAVTSAVRKGDRDSLARYLRTDRARQRLWAVKDPRLSLFAGLWVQAAGAAGVPLAALLMVRHPAEVAQSLAVRDGIPRGQGLLLWLDYTIAALERAGDIPLRVGTYDELMESPALLLERVRSLPGWSGLQIDPQAIAEVVQPEQRHHHSTDADDVDLLPGPIRDLWRALQTLSTDADGLVPAGFATAWRERLAPFLDLAETLTGAWRVTEQRLWERVARAEAAAGHQKMLESQLLNLEKLQLGNHEELVRVLSEDIRRMQEIAADSQAEAARISAALDDRQAQLDSACFERAKLVQQVDERQRTVEAMAAELAEHVEARAQLVQTVADRHAAVEALQSQLAEQLAAREALVATVADRQGEVEALQSQLAEQVRRGTELVDLVGERQARVELLQARMTEGFEERAGLLAEIGRRQDDLDATRALAGRLHDERDGIAAGKRDVERELEAASARATTLLAELHAARHQCSVLGESDRTLRQVVDSRSWRWTRPLRGAMRLLRGEWGDHETSALRGVLLRLVGRTPGPNDSARTVLIENTLPTEAEAGTPSQLLDQAPAPGVHLAVAGDGLADVFVWAVIDWHFRMQRPQHLARSLAARGHRVFYISNNFVDSSEPGFHVDSLDESGRLFQVHLNLVGAPAIYFGLPAQEQARALHTSLAALLGWTHTRASISLVQHPYWSPLLRSVPNAQVVYDCMDHHGGFENNAPCVLEAEEAIIRDAELVIVTSSWLEQEIAPNARATAMIRNAGEHDFFSVAPVEVFHDPGGRQVIGYYGAIAEWFDLELIRAVARAHPQALVLLVGNDTAGAAAALADVPNVEFSGEVPYARLPYYLYGFDVTLLPFQVIPLTLATNPVKVYEYLAAGKPVVAVDLPEMLQFEGLVTVADSAGFADAVGDVLGSPADPAQVAARRAFAAGQTWDHRAASLDHALALIEEPVVSVVVLTYNNLAFSEACLFSVEAYSDYPQLEVIVVDNASSDGSPEWLRDWAQEPSAAGHRRRLILNEENLGFSAGNNVGLAAATGEVLVLLNNDTYVTPGWVRTLCAHLRRDPGLGLVGPITNNIGNEARIEIQYADLTEMIRKAGEYTRARPGQSIALHTAAFFCVAMPREVYERVGPMDEDFGVGFFEDDDYCRRVHLEGYRVACAEDVFVHHHLSASFDSLGVERKRVLFEKNKAIYEAKWGPWTPHVHRAEDKGLES